MRKITLLLLFVFCISFVSAELDLEKLKAAHINAMRFHGRADLLAQKDHKMFFGTSDGQMISCFLTKKFATYYTETKDRKFYWEVKPIEGGFEITVKINFMGQTFERKFVILVGKNSFSIKNLSTSKVDFGCMLKCIGPKALKCWKCLASITCWLTCIGMDAFACFNQCK